MYENSGISELNIVPSLCGGVGSYIKMIGYLEGEFWRRDIDVKTSGCILWTIDRKTFGSDVRRQISLSCAAMPVFLHAQIALIGAPAADAPRFFQY